MCGRVQGTALEKACAGLLGKYGLLPDQIAKRYLVPFRRRILFGLTSQLVELPPLNVSIQLLVPRPDLKLHEPGCKSGQVVRRELGNGGFDLFNAHNG